MGELALRRIQAAPETTRGTALPATKRIYGTATITKAQPNRYAVEDRGNFVDKFRGNKKLIEAGFSVAHDLLFEDTPWWLATTLRGVNATAGGSLASGGLTPTGSATVGYTWQFLPDVNTDLLDTTCFEVGDDTVAWRGAFGATDTADWTLNLTEAVTCTSAGFVADWIPQSYAAPGVVTNFTGFTGSIAEHAVESVMGYQAKLFVDPSGTAAGTTQVTGRFIEAGWGVHNQNKRKYYGDGTAVFTRLGRGRRQVHCSVTFEAIDTAQYADFYNNSPKVVRIGMYGTAITGTTFGTTNGAINPGTVTAITTNALTAAIPAGAGIVIGGVTFTVTAAGAALSATSIPVQSQQVLATIATAATVFAAKTALFDFYGIWDTFQIGARDTNTTFQFDLMGVYDSNVGREMTATIVNGSNTL